MEKLQNSEVFSRKIQESPLLVVQFGSAQCAPCTAIEAKLDRFTQAFPEVQSVYVSVEKFPETAASQNVFTVPAVLVFAEGRLTLREAGYFSLDALLERVSRYAELLKSEE